MDPIVKELVWDKTEGKCWYCGTNLDKDHNKLNGFTTDHFQPRCDDGQHKLNNLVPCCRQCNCGKGGQSLEEYRITKKLKQFRQKNNINFSRKQLDFLGIEYNINLLNEFNHSFWFEGKGLST